MNFFHKTIQLKTKEEYDFIDLTEEVVLLIKESDIKNGLINLQTMHTTATFILNENEPLLLKDIKRQLENVFSKRLKYEHDNFSKRTVNLCDDECANGHSHCKAILLPPTLTLNIKDGNLQLGQWQRILFVELDRARKRSVQIMIVGE